MVAWVETLPYPVQGLAEVKPEIPIVFTNGIRVHQTFLLSNGQSFGYPVFGIGELASKRRACCILLEDHNGLERA